MLCGVLVEQARHGHMSDYKNQYIIDVPPSPSRVKVRDTTVVPSELNKGGKSSGLTLTSQIRIIQRNYGGYHSILLVTLTVY